MTLYDINEEISNCITVDEETGECIVDEARLAELQLERDAKVENIAMYIKNLAAEQPAIQAEVKRLQEMKKANENKIQRLKDYLKEQLHEQKFKSLRASVSFRSTKSVTITDAAKVPDEYKRYQDPTVDKIALGKALASGQTIDGAVLTYSKSVVIK